MWFVFLFIVFALCAFGIKLDMTKPQAKPTVWDVLQASMARQDAEL